MAILTAIAVPATQVRSLDTGTFLQTYKPVLPATANADSQVIATQRHAGRLYGAHMRVPATLGAGATVKLQLRRASDGVAVDITAATAAATAQVVAGTGLLPIDFAAGDTIEALVGGAAVTNGAAPAIEVDLLMQRA